MTGDYEATPSSYYGGWGGGSSPSLSDHEESARSDETPRRSEQMQAPVAPPEATPPPWLEPTAPIPATTFARRSPAMAPVSQNTQPRIDLRELRMAHHGQERQVHLVAGLHLVLATAVFALAVFMVTTDQGIWDPSWARLGDAAFTLLPALLSFSVFIGLRRLAVWARGLSTLIIAPFILAVPVGTVVAVGTLRALWGTKNRVLFTQEYRDAVAATPDIRTRMPALIWALLLLFILIAAAVLYTA